MLVKLFYFLIAASVSGTSSAEFFVDDFVKDMDITSMSHFHLNVTTNKGTCLFYKAKLSFKKYIKLFICASVGRVDPQVSKRSSQSYSPTGFVFLAISYLPDCFRPPVLVGYPVNTCFLEPTFSYKFQLPSSKFVAVSEPFFRKSNLIKKQYLLDTFKMPTTARIVRCSISQIKTAKVLPEQVCLLRHQSSEAVSNIARKIPS
jgi:hypothetical protein